MDYSQFLQMIPEATLMAILIVLFIADFASSKQSARRWFNPLACVLLLVQTLVCLIPQAEVNVFGGMYVTTSAVDVMKAILAGGTLIVFIQSRQWLSRPDMHSKEGEFYMLIVSTLLGMYMMMSAGHFLMFFLGLEMASIPFVCTFVFVTSGAASAGAAT